MIAFKVPNVEVDKTGTKFFTHWEPDKKTYTLQVSADRRESIYAYFAVINASAPLTVYPPSAVHSLHIR